MIYDVTIVNMRPYIKFENLIMYFPSNIVRNMMNNPNSTPRFGKNFINMALEINLYIKNNSKVFMLYCK